MASQQSVTEQVAEWVVNARYASVPENGPLDVKTRFLDTFGVQVAGMSERTGQVIVEWVKSQGLNPVAGVTASGLRTTPALAALANGTAGHASDLDSGGMFSSHPTNTLVSAIMALADRLDFSGEDAMLAFLVGWEVTAVTNAPCMADPENHSMLKRGWHNQGFQTALGAAAACAKLMDFDVEQTRMAIGHAASAMGGLHKNRGSDTKPFHAGNPAMHGVMAAELVALGFTANGDILDGPLGVAKLLSPEYGDDQQILEKLGDWDFCTTGSKVKQYASCAGGHWSMDALKKIVEERPIAADEVDNIDVHLNAALQTQLPYHSPQKGHEGRFSIEYDLVTILLDGKGGIPNYTDEMVQRPVAQDLMKRVNPILLEGKPGQGVASTVVVHLKDGETLEATVDNPKGFPAWPLTEGEIVQKFYDCSAELMGAGQQDEIVKLCLDLDNLKDLKRLGELVCESDK